MKTQPNDAAFSGASDGYGNPTVGYGLTKREYFAAVAMQGLLANSYNDGFNKPLSHASNEEIAVMSVGQADALIKELSKIEKIKPSELTPEEIDELKKNDEDLK